MIRFGYFYLNGRLTIYDVAVELNHGRQVYVASLSEDPRICFRAIRIEHAVEQLKAYMQDATAPRRRARVTWLPESATPSARI